MNLSDYKRIYFIGVGGIGMSALARYFIHQGAEVFGSDLSKSDLINDLQKEGLKFFEKQESRNINQNFDCVIYTAAIPDDHPELLEAKSLGLPTFTYAEMLGQVSADSFTIAISGTHGKTTTTAMVGHILSALGKKPNVIVGSLLAENHSNFVPGSTNGKKIFVVEACEYKRSFLNLKPNILVITNLEEDHLDYYKDLKDIQSAFRDLVEKVAEDGFIVCDSNLDNLKPVIKGFEEKVIDYSAFLKDVPEAMPVFGNHNVKNAAAGLAVAKALKISLKKSSDSLLSFRGTWRRLEFKKELRSGASVYDDYGHHPTEIGVTLQALSEKFPDKRIAAIFQPHLFSRTKQFLKDFAKIFANNSDYTILYPIYPAREKDDGSISSEMLADEIRLLGGQVDFIDSYSEISLKISSLDKNWVIVVLGAGDLYQIVDHFE